MALSPSCYIFSHSEVGGESCFSCHWWESNSQWLMAGCYFTLCRFCFNRNLVACFCWHSVPVAQSRGCCMELGAQQSPLPFTFISRLGYFQFLKWKHFHIGCKARPCYHWDPKKMSTNLNAAFLIPAFCALATFDPHYISNAVILYEAI